MSNLGGFVNLKGSSTKITEDLEIARPLVQESLNEDTTGNNAEESPTH